ncbi:MAG: DUF202 domain-containing protein [Rubripirellula sp.]
MTDQPKPPSRSENLALVRTDLANERTLLAYGRTSLMMAGTGVTLIKFFPESAWIRAIGWGLATVGATVGLVGLLRFHRLRKRLRQNL